MSVQDSHPRLAAFGLAPFFLRQLEPLDLGNLALGRIVLEQRGEFTVMTEEGEIQARTAGRLRHHAAGPQELPSIGDWVLIRHTAGSKYEARIEQVLERRSRFSRKAAGTQTAEQVVAANIDRVFIVMGLDGDFNLRRLERLLITAHESGAEPIVVLNKADLSPSLEEQAEAVRKVAGDVLVVLLSCKTRLGLDRVRTLLEPGLTVALIGSSGVGKSTLVNCLAGAEIMRTGSVRRSDDRGTHTTRHRQMHRLPRGALLIDNPGIREIQPWADEQVVNQAFDDIEELAAGCHFRDCRHGEEPGCEVAAAVERGDLEPGRLRSFLAMVAETDQLQRRQDQLARVEETKRWRAIHRAQRQHRPRGFR